MRKFKVYVASPLDEKGSKFLDDLRVRLNQGVELIHTSTHGKRVDFKSPTLSDDIYKALEVDLSLINQCHISVINLTPNDKGLVDLGCVSAFGMTKAICDGVITFASKMNPFFQYGADFSFTNVKDLADKINEIYKLEI
jgi:nucleoside 2-deoxyribosyltransferase